MLFKFFIDYQIIMSEDSDSDFFDNDDDTSEEDEVNFIEFRKKNENYLGMY